MSMFRSSENPAPPALTSLDDVGAALSPAPHGRASWSGLVKLSLLTFPVKAYPAAVTSQHSHFHQLHAGCGQRIRYEKHCPVHGKVEAGAITSGYPYARDQHLILDDAELDKLRPARDKTLNLERFLDPGQIDPLLFSGRSLYLLPDGPAAQRPYEVLAQSLHQRRKWALGRIVLSGHRQLVLLRPAGPVLTLQVLHYPAQVRSGAALAAELRSGGISDEEAQLAGMLIDAASAATIAWSEYRDDTAEKLAALVEAKLQGQPLPAPVPEDVSVLSLLDALKKSVVETTKQAPAPAPASSTTITPAPGKARKKRRSA